MERNNCRGDGSPASLTKCREKDGIDNIATYEHDLASIESRIERISADVDKDKAPPNADLDMYDLCFSMTSGLELSSVTRASCMQMVSNRAIPIGLGYSPGIPNDETAAAMKEAGRATGRSKGPRAFLRQKKWRRTS